MKVSRRVSELQTRTVGLMVGWLQFTKGHNSVKTVDGVMALNLFISWDDALYLYHVSRKYLKGCKKYSIDMICILQFTKGHNFITRGPRGPESLT